MQLSPKRATACNPATTVFLTAEYLHVLLISTATERCHMLLILSGAVCCCMQLILNAANFPLLW